jgi:hypothetical protein
MKLNLFLKLRLAICTTLCGMFFSAAAFADTVAGVKVEDTMQVGTQTLKLNGAGIRYKVFFKVYVAALYLPELKSTTAEVLAMPGAKRVNLVMLRELSRDDLANRFLEGLRNNLTPDERNKLASSMISFGKLFSSVPVLNKGDVMTFDWVPGMGVVCTYNGQKIGETIADANFYNAVLKIWLGEHPADERLKHKMLNDKE